MNSIEKKKFWQRIGKSACPDEIVRDLSIKEIKKSLKKNANVIDIGCGDGYCTFKFLDKKVKSIKGIDFSATSIKNAKKNKDILGLKKKITFEVGDVLNLSKFQNSFDNVITIRCLINLDSKKKQHSALKEIYKTLKKGGTYLMCENFNENLENLNKMRKKLNLDKIKTRWHNKYLSSKEIKDYATKKLKFKILEERNFASSYYFLTRVVKPYLFKINDKKLKYNDSFNTLAAKFESFGDFSPMKLIILKKK
jgi:ubiquinone/menaquinone biosynthesis C-methylase UbiE